MKRFFMAAAIAGAALLLSWAGPGDVEAQVAAPQALIIEGATLIDGNGGAPLADSAIAIQGNRITAVGRRGQVPRPANAQIIDGTGKYVIPGLIDAKSNHASNFNEGYLIWGVTTAIVSGGSGDAGTAERDAINHGILRGPRLFLSFASINGGGNDTGIPSRNGYPVRTPEEARALQIRFFEAGADFASSGEGAGPPALYAAMVEEAKKRGKPSVMRAVGPLTAARELADMGAEVAIHAGNAGIQITTDETVERWRNYVALPPDAYSDMDDTKAQQLANYLAFKGLALEPDMIAMDRGFPKNWKRVQEENAQWYREYLANPALRSYFPHIQAAGYVENAKSPDTYLQPGAVGAGGNALNVRRRGFINKTRFLKMFLDAGGKILAASDIPQSPPGFGMHQEIAVFVEDVGLTPMQAILSATGWSADSFKLPDLGRVQAGKLADLIILDADPLASILNTRKISSVIKDGQVVDRTYNADALKHSFKIGMLESGQCCFSSPALEGGAWLAAMKAAAWNPAARNGGFQGAGGVDSNISPTPGLESIYPYIIDQNSPATVVTVRGFNFVKGSQVLIDGKPVPTRNFGRQELEITLDEAFLRNPGRFVIRVKNPEPITGDWGDTSNPAKLIIPYAFTKAHSQNRF